MSIEGMIKYPKEQMAIPLEIAMHRDGSRTNRNQGLATSEQKSRPITRAE
jgi:hypothetical protein